MIERHEPRGNARHRYSVHSRRGCENVEECEQEEARSREHYEQRRLKFRPNFRMCKVGGILIQVLSLLIGRRTFGDKFAA